MGGRILSVSLRGASWRKLACSVAVLVVLVLTAFGAARADQKVTKWFVEVPVDSLAEVRDLAAAGFDVAGVSGELLVGIVGTGEDLDRLHALGYSYTIRSSNEDELGILALQDYTDAQELSTFMDQVVANHPTLAQKMTLRSTLFEGQSLYALKITQDVGQPNLRPSFIIDAQHHAREVMTPEILRDMIDYLTTRYATDPQVQRWVDNINIYVVGSVNPDGAMYVFQHDNMWRKNRHPTCQVDVNRNYPFMWASCNGSSGDCSSDVFRGMEPASEPETSGMLELVSTVRPFFQVSYHSYGEYLMWSYGCTDPNEQAAMNDIGVALNNILLNDNGTTPFAVAARFGPIWSSIYAVDGGSVDTSYGSYGVYGYTIEVNATGFQPDYATWRNITVQRQRTAWQFFLDKTLDGSQIRGRITNAATGAAVPARIDVQEVTFTHGESARRADNRGVYHWLTRSGQTYHVTYSMPGYCTDTRTVTVGSGPSTVDVTMAQPTPPATVSAVGAGENQIDVSWSAAPNASRYRVLRSLTAGGPYAEVGLVDAPQTIFHDTTVAGGPTYYYVIRALQPCESGASVEASASTSGVCSIGPGFAGVSAVSSAESTTCGLTVQWATATAYCGGNVTYKVFRSASSPFTPSAGNMIASGLSGTQYTDHDGLAHGVTMYYIARAVDSANGAEDVNTVIGSGAPAGPTSIGTWTDDAGDTGSATFTTSSPWSVQATGGKTGPKVYATGAYPNNLCSALTTPAITLQTGSVLSFASKYSIEGDWDAGIVEVAEGPNFTTWTRLTTVNYPDQLTNTGNACGFPRSFAGTVFSKNYTTPVYSASDYTGSLSAYNGKDIKLRFRISSDATGNGAGWWIDDVAVTNAVVRASCSAGVGPNPREVSPPGAAMTASRVETGSGVRLSYTPGCGTLDNAVYWGQGPILGAPAWTNSACALGNTGETTFDPGDPPPGDLFYFVIVGQNAAKEGSYGQSFDGATNAERPEAVAIGACDKPQDLSGDCP